MYSDVQWSSQFVCCPSWAPQSIRVDENGKENWFDEESDKIKILSGVFEGKTTGTPISMIIFNEDQKSGDYSEIKDKFRPSHADYTYEQKYGLRDHRGGGRGSHGRDGGDPARRRRLGHRRSGLVPLPLPPRRAVLGCRHRLTLRHRA